MLCPECKKELETKHIATVMKMFQDNGWPYERYEYIGHCHNCDSDWTWERVYEFGDMTETFPKQKFWG